MTPFVAVSYHYKSDIEFVRQLAEALRDQGLGCWYLETVTKKRRPSEDYLSGSFDWREEPQNWQATFLEHLLIARGVIVVLSREAHESRQMEGRCMWRERSAIEFIERDDQRRVLEVEVFDIDQDAEDRMSEVVIWARRAISLPRVNRAEMKGDVAAGFNLPTGVSGAMQLRERKTHYKNWCEIVRLDLYDGQWHCRQCGLQSWNYVLAHENPPIQCPRCGYDGERAQEKA